MPTNTNMIFESLIYAYIMSRLASMKLATPNKPFVSPDIPKVSQN